MPDDIKHTWDRHVLVDHLRSMAQHIWGPDSLGMLTDYEPQDLLLMKYQHSILDMEHEIRGKRVLDMGCNHGLWSYVAHRHGAEMVVGLEPRGMFTKGLNRFAEEHRMPMKFVQGFDTDAKRVIAEHKIDTALLLSNASTLEWEHLMYDIRLAKVDTIIMQENVIPDEWIQLSPEMRAWMKDGPGQQYGFSMQFRNTTHTMRDGVDPVSRTTVDPDTGYALLPSGRPDPQIKPEVRMTKSREYVKNFVRHLDYRIVKETYQTEDIRQTVGSDSRHKLFQWLLLKLE